MLSLNATLKNYLLIVVKIAVNAVLTNSALMALLPTVFNMHDAAGWWNLLKLTGSSIAAREAMVWVPIWLKWSETSANPTAMQTVPPGGIYVPPPSNEPKKP